MYKFIYIAIILLSEISCQDKSNIIHQGKNLSEHCDVEIDTMCISIENSSGEGNFYFKDSVITFVDVITCKFYDINLHGQLIESYFGKGRGRNEIRALRYAYPIENDPLNRGIMVDNNNMITIFDTKNKNINYSKRIDFGWSDRRSRRNQYKHPNVYNIAEFTDLGVSFYLDSDSMVMIPVNIVNRLTSTPDRIESDRYNKGAIFGKLNLATMKVEKVMGRFPEIFQNRPMPDMESFQYLISNGLLYVNHAVDSLIYVYKYPDELQYTIGYECSEINRNYTSTKLIEQNETFNEDIQHVGLNSGLILCSENSTLCRTYIKSTATGEAGMQIYDNNNNLIADVNMPAYFKLLGYKGGYYYGVRLISMENLETTDIVLYRIKIKLSN